MTTTIPCGHEKPTADCRFCYLAATDTKYAKLWGERALPPEQKPSLFLRILSAVASDKDVGVGDTIHRLLPGSATLQRLYRRLIGSDCGCQNRREKLNARFPYAASRKVNTHADRP